MKKLGLFAMVLGLVMSFNGYVSAFDTITGNVVAPCPADFKPKVDDTFKIVILTTVNDSQGKKAYFNLFRDNKTACGVDLKFTQAQLTEYLKKAGSKGKTAWSGKVKKIGSFTQGLKTGNLASLKAVNETTIDVSFANNGKVFGTLTLDAVREK